MTEPPNTWNGDRQAWGLSADEYDHYLRVMDVYVRMRLDQARTNSERAGERHYWLGLVLAAALVVAVLVVLTDWLW